MQKFYLSTTEMAELLGIGKLRVIELSTKGNSTPIDFNGDLE